MTSVKPRVLVLSPVPPQRCGVSNHVAGALETLKSDVEFTLLTYRECGVDRGLQTVRVHRLPTLFRADQVPLARGASYAATAAVVATASAWRADLIHAHCVLPQGVSALLASVFARTPFVYTSHGADYELQTGRNRWLDALCKNVVRRAATVTAVDAYAVRAFESRGAQRVVRVPTALRDDAFERLAALARARSGDRLAFIGHVNEHKGVDLAIRALAVLRHMEPDRRYILDILGSGSPASVARATELAHALRVHDRVHFWGVVPDVLPFLARASVLWHPTRKDGMPTSVLEAFAARVPVVATRVGALPEMLGHGEAGLLVDAEPLEIAEATVSVRADPTATHGRVKQAFEFAREHRASMIYPMYLDVYREVIHGV